MKRILSAVLAAAVLAAALMTCGCSKPPELEDVRGELEALIGASAEINDIFFGAGLPVYDRDTASGDGSAAFDEASGLYYWIFDDPAAGKIIKYYSTGSREYVYGLFDGKTSEGGTPGLYVGADGSGSFTGADGKSETFAGKASSWRITCVTPSSRKPAAWSSVRSPSVIVSNRWKTRSA